MPPNSRILLYGLVWLGAFLRLPALFTNHFHPDEALFASWARLIAVWRDPLLLTQMVDKPPLLFYAQAIFYPLLGLVDWAARMPNLIVSILLIPLTALLAWRLYRSEAVALLAALFVTASPLAIQFSATAFTDPLLTTLLYLSLLAAAGRPKPLISGLFLALAVGTKYQAVFFAPLVLGLGWVNGWRWPDWRRWLAGFLAFTAVLLLWTSLDRGGPNLWAAQVANFGGFRLSWSWELLPRLNSWFNLLDTSFGSLLLTGLCLLSAPLLFLWGINDLRQKANVDKLLILFCACYFLLHWLVAVPVWDRYVLPIVPLLAILLARGLSILFALSRAVITSKYLNQPRARLTLIFAGLLTLAILLLPGSLRARDGQWPVGGQAAADQGAWQVAEYLADSPYGTVLYDHWYSWYWRYYFFDKGVYVSWFPHPAALVEDLTVFGHEPGLRYLILPAGSSSQPVQRAAQQAGFHLRPVFETDNEGGMILYLVESS